MKSILSVIVIVGVTSLTFGSIWQNSPAAPVSIPTNATLVATSARLADDVKFRGDLAEVVANAGADELIPISIVLTEQADQAAINVASRIGDKKVRRQAVTDILKQHAAKTQRGILELLSDGQPTGQVGQNIRSLWIVSAIATEVTPGVALALAGRNDVSHINWDRPLGEELFPIEPQPLAKIAIPSPLAGSTECGVQLMGAPNVWSDLDVTGRDVVVGIIDTGCCVTHPDLVNQIWLNPGETPGNGIDDDNNGFVDDIHGWNHWQNNSDISDANGHGTHTAGTVCGDGANGTITGMAPDCAMMILKFWNDFGGESVVWACQQYALDNGADVTTASIGWPHIFNPDRASWRMVTENSMAGGVVVVYAAGNEGSGNEPDNVRTPGDVPDMITCGATDCSDLIAGFSSRGPVTWQNIQPYNDWPYPPGKLKPTVSAPGVNTVSTSNNCSGYRSLSGTSMATPHIAGAIALMLEANPNLDHWEVKQILKDTSVDLGAGGPDNNFGHGRVDALAAVIAAIDSLPLPLCAGGGTLVEGTGEMGDFNATCGTEDSYWAAHGSSLFFQVSDPVVQFELTATTAGFGGATISVDVEASKENDSGNLNLRALLFNFASDSYVSLPGVMPLTTTDQIQRFELPGGANPDDFIEPGTNEIRLLLQTIQTSGLPNVRTQLDAVFFNLE